MRAFLLLLALIPLTACTSDDDDSSDDDDDDDDVVDAGPDAQRDADAAVDAPPRGTAMIGAMGGSVSSEDGVLTLTIPAGALTSDATFTIRRLEESEVPDEIERSHPVDGAAYEIGPEGTAFAMAATLTWSFDAIPMNARGGDGHPYVLFGASRDAAGMIAPHRKTLSHIAEGTLVVESLVDHLSIQWLTADGSYLADVTGTPTPTAAVDVELGGGRHAVDVPWTSPRVAIQALEALTNATVEMTQVPRSVVSDVDDEDWNDELENAFDDDAYLGYQEFEVSLSIGGSYSPEILPRWLCTAEGGGAAGLYTFLTFSVLGKEFTGSTEHHEDVECYEREQKAEYTAQSEMLGAANIAELAVGAMAMASLGDTAPSTGYRVVIPPGATIEICVLSGGGRAYINYYPRFPPGYEFTDTEPGCTNIRNLDADNPNEVLVKVDRVDGTPNVTIGTRAL